MLVDRTCLHCGCAFQALAVQVNRGRGVLCSPACRDAHRRNRTIRTCRQCGGPFEVKASDLVYGRGVHCSTACRDAAVRRPRHERTCRYCGIPFQITTWQADKGEGRFCSAECRDLGAHDARRDPPDLRLRNRWYGRSWRPARRLARKRDGRCVDCGITAKEAGKELDVHHIVAFKRFGVERHVEANDLRNLVTLCQSCHIKREWATNWSERAKPDPVT